MMKALTNTLRPSLVLLLLFTLLLGGAYPGLSAMMGRALFPKQAKGSAIIVEGEIRGSLHLGQNFESPRYFHSRPSQSNYDTRASGASNLSPGNPEQVRKVEAYISRLKAEHPASTSPVPVDLVTASASGLDPHISVAAAQWQVPRVAKKRKLPEAQLYDLVNQYTESRQFGLLGEPAVNVLLLNMALDLQPKAR